MTLKPGLRLKSAACSTEIIVIAARGDIDLRCGGLPMSSDATPSGTNGNGGPGSGTKIGKRYVSGAPDAPEPYVKVLCVTSGAGSLSVGDTPMQEEQARALPASD
jgi:hypothetical protein